MGLLTAGPQKSDNARRGRAAALSHSAPSQKELLKGAVVVKVTNVFGDVYSGQAGKAGVFAHWKGRQYRRKYVIPSNPNTIPQQTIRGYFTAAVTEWHTWLSIMRLAYDYLATGQVKSGFNLLVGRWVKAAAAAEATPTDPLVGLKQFASATALQDDEALPAAASGTLSVFPVKVDSVTDIQANTSGVDCEAVVYLENGLIHIIAALVGEVTIDYESGGRVITGEVLGDDPAQDALYRTQFWPIDEGTVEIYEATVKIDGLEIELATGDFYHTNTVPGDGTMTIDYTSYTAIGDVKLEDTKVDTSFITWRGYSGATGMLVLAQTIEDQAYDQVITRSGYESVYRANWSAAVVVADELLTLVAV